MFLVRIATDLRVQKLLARPMVMVWFGEDGGVEVSDLVEKDVIVCDSCCIEVAVADKDAEERGLPAGYALCDGESVVEVVCESCRRRYFPTLPLYDDLDQALGGGRA